MFQSNKVRALKADRRFVGKNDNATLETYGQTDLICKKKKAEYTRFYYVLINKLK